MNQMAKKLLAFLVVFTMVATSVIGVVEPLKVSAETQIQTELPTIVVTGEEIINGGVYSKDNVGKERAYTLDEVKAVANEDPERTEKNQYGYSALNTYGSKNFYLQEGVRLEALLEKSGLTDENFQRAKIAFVSGADGVSTYFDPAKTTYGTEADKASAGVSQKLSAIRYYYPKGKETPPSEEGAQEVPTVLAWAGAKKADQLPTQVKENDGLTLATGQLGLGDYNNPMYNRDLNKVEVGKSIETKVLSIDKDSFTRREILLMERGDRSYTYQTKGGLQTDYVRGVPMSVLLKDYKDSDIVKFSAADGYEVAASGMTKAQLIKGNYILGYEKGTGPSTLNGIFDTAKKDPQIHGCFSLYGDGVAPAKLVNSIAVSKDSGIDFATSNYKHINNGGVTGQEGPYNIDAITGATLTVEGPGVKNSVPLSVRILENQNAGGFRGVYSDLENGNKTYEGIKLSYILNSMPSGNKVELTDTAKKVQIKNRARQTIAEFTLEQIKEAEERGKPILVSYGVGSQDGTNVAPYVYDGAAGYKPELNNDDGCLKLVYDKEAITGDANGAYSSFGNMAYIYVMEESEPGYKHTGAVYGDPNYSQYILSMAGTGMGREINLTVKQLEELANSEEGIGDYNSSNIAFRKAYSLTNTTYWSVNEYEGVKLYNLLQKYGLKNDLSNDTKIRFNAWDGYISNEVFTIDDLKKPEKFGYYEKNALDINDGSYTPTEEDKKDAGYPVMLAYGVNRYPYVKSPQDEGYAKGLTNSGGPLRVIFGKREYHHNNGSNQVQKVQDIIVGEGTYRYSTHKYHEKDIYKEMAAAGKNDIQVTVNNNNGTEIKNQTYTLGEIEDIIYGKDVSKQDAAAAKAKGYYQLSKNGTYYSDLYEGVNLNYLMTKVLEVPGNKGTVTFSDGTNSIDVSLEDVLAIGANPEEAYKTDGLSGVLAFAKNGAPMVTDKNAPGYESKILEDSFTVKNDGGPLAVFIPSTNGTDSTSNAKSLKNVTSIKINLQADNYAHIDAPYDALANETITIEGEGTGLSQAKTFKVSDVEGKQNIIYTGDYNIKSQDEEAQIRYRGLSLYDFLRSSDVGLKINAKDVIITGQDGTQVTYSIGELKKADYINGQNESISNLKTLLAFGSGDVDTKDLNDGKPLVATDSSLGYDAAYHNGGGPLAVVTGQTTKEDENGNRIVKQVKKIEVTASPITSVKHNINDIYKAFSNREVLLKVQSAEGKSVWEKKYTVDQLESMDDVIRRDDFSWVGNHQHEGLSLWDFVQREAGSIPGMNNPSAVTVYSGTFSKDVLSVFGKDQLENGIKHSGDSSVRKPILMAYSQDGYPLVEKESDDGYMAAAGNLGGPIRLITHENQGACVKSVDKVVVTLQDGVAPPDPSKDKVFTVKNQGEEKAFTLAELKALTATTKDYQVKGGAKVSAKGVLVADIAKALNITNPYATIDITAVDGFENTPKGESYKNITLKEAAEKNYLIAYEADGKEIDDLVKNSTERTKIRVYRHYTQETTSWLNELKNISGAKMTDYAFVLTVNGKVHPYTITQLKEMAATTKTYQVKGANKTAKGVLLSDLLTTIGVSRDTAKVDIKTYDNYQDGQSENQQSYWGNTLADVKAKEYLVAYEEDGKAIADTVKNDVVSTGIRIYRNQTEDATKWINELKNVTVGEVSDHDFQSMISDGKDLPLAGIRNIVSDHNGGIWIGTYGGGLVHQNKEGTRTLYNTESTPALGTAFVSAVAADKAGGVWFTQNASYTQPENNKGVGYLDKEGNITFYTVESTPNTIPNNYVQAIYLDDKGNNDISDDVVWFGSFGGITKKDGEVWTTYGKKEGLPAESVNTIVPDGRGGLWIGCYPDTSGKETITYSGGYAYLSAEGKITAYPAGENEKIDKTKLADVWVRGIAVDKEGGAWIVRSGSYSYLENVGGRIDYVSASGEVKKYTGKALLGDTLTDNSEIRTVMVDAAGGLWFGTSGNGVVYCEDLKTVSKVYNSKTAAWAENKSLDNIYCTANIDGTLYVGSNGGVSFMNVAMPEETALSIYKGEQLFSEMTNSRLQSITKLEGQQHYQYAGYNTYPTWKTFKNDQGPTIAGIFKSAGIDIEAIEADQQITFVGADGVKSSFTKEQLFADRYFYPNGKEGTEKGSVGGSLAQEGKVNVPATLNLNNEGGTLQYGQRLPNEQTVDGFTKYIAQGGKIIIGDKAESWTAITGISHVSGTTVTPGTKISLDLPPANGEAKVFYTLDGSTPNAASTMYNYQANRWGGSKNEIVLNEEGEVTLKVVVINRGKKDSGVSTFNYTVKKNTAKPDPDPTPNPDPLPVPDPVPVPGPLPTEGVGEGNEKRPETTDKRTKTETVATNKPEEEQAPVSPKAKDLNQWMKQITLDVSIGGKASSLDEAAKMDLLKSLLTEADYVALEGGEALAVNIAMEFNSNKVSAEEKKEMEEAVKARNLNILSFVDISVKKKLGDGQWENIHKTQKPLTLTIDVPTEYQKENTLCLIRLHEGNLTILQDEDGNKGTITIKSDAFSPYALAVDATEKGFPWLWIIIPIGIIGLITYIGLFRKKKAKI